MVAINTVQAQSVAVARLEAPEQDSVRRQVEQRESKEAQRNARERERPPRDADAPGGDRTEAIDFEFVQKLLGLNARLRIDQDEGTGDFVYKFVDKSTGEIVKEFPPEKLRDLLAAQRDAAKQSSEGAVLDRRV